MPYLDQKFIVKIKSSFKKSEFNLKKYMIFVFTIAVLVYVSFTKIFKIHIKINHDLVPGNANSRILAHSFLIEGYKN